MTVRSFSGRPIRAIIDRGAFQHNLRVVAERVPNSKLLVVIKSDAYGHGLVALAKAAGDHDLAVATSDEAKRLLDAGIGNRIWVLEGPFDATCLALVENHSLVWVIHSLWQLELLQQAALSAPVSVWLKLDTGMHRLGLAPAQLGLALTKLAQLPGVELHGCMSHFASSDQPDAASVRQQIALFDRLLEQYSLTHLPQSLANSGAILYYPQAARAWVRPGIMLYGATPNASVAAANYHLQAVMTLESAIMSLRELPEGESVGYGATWTARRKSLIAMVAGGYGDGYPRHAPSGTPVSVAGQIVPLVGRVSMDMLALDVTDLSTVNIGDRVELWGPQVSVDQVATLAGTIGYELLTGVTARVPRIYC